MVRELLVVAIISFINQVLNIGRLIHYSRGDNDHGKLGHGSGNNGLILCYSTTPKKVEALDGEVVVDVICEQRFTIIFTASDLIYICGDGMSFNGSISSLRQYINFALKRRWQLSP